MAIVRSGLQNLRKWPHNPRVWTLFILLLYFSRRVSSFLEPISLSAGKKLSPWLLPYLLHDRFFLLCVSLCMLLFFCDAPFLDNLQPYTLFRIGRRRWLIGQLLYIGLCGLLIMVVLEAGLLFFARNSLTWTTDWGPCLRMLAHDNPFFSRLAENLVLSREAVPVFVQTFLMGWLIAWLLGSLVLFLNLLLNRSVGILIGCAFCVLDYALAIAIEDSPLMFWLCPISWMNPELYTGGNAWKWLPRIGIAVALIGLLGLLSWRILRRYTIELAPET